MQSCVSVTGHIRREVGPQNTHCYLGKAQKRVQLENSAQHRAGRKPVLCPTTHSLGRGVDTSVDGKLDDLAADEPDDRSARSSRPGVSDQLVNLLLDRNLDNVGITQVVVHSL